MEGDDNVRTGPGTKKDLGKSIKQSTYDLQHEKRGSNCQPSVDAGDERADRLSVSG